jgi:hypothetical protein
MMIRPFAICLAVLANTFATSLLATAVAAQDVTTDIGTLDKEAAEKAFPAKPSYSPYAGRNFPTRPYFGDTHLHTSFSMDAGAFGARLGPRDAYRFARATCQTFTTPRFPGGNRPFGRNGVFSAADGRRC